MVVVAVAAVVVVSVDNTVAVAVVVAVEAAVDNTAAVADIVVFPRVQINQ